MARVRLTGVAKSYGGSVALRPTDLDIREGEFFTLLGPSGSGKTTLLRTIGGFVEPSSGRVEIGGRDVTRLPPYHRNLGVVFQSYALFPHLSVLSNVAFGLKMRGLARPEREKRARDALGLVGLDDLGGRFPGELSGGQQQRVALARALVIEPDVLLLDEPLGALDLALRKRMQRELRALHMRLGRTFVYVTHDQDEALTLSDRIAVLAEGRVLQVDTPEAIYDRPVSAFVAAFLGESNVLGGALGPNGDFTLHDGTLVVAPPLSARPAGAAALAIRPERLRLAGPHEAGVRLDGALEAVTFRGAVVTLSVRLGAGGLVDATLPPGALATIDARPGAPVALAFDPADARLVAADASA